MSVELTKTEAADRLLEIKLLVKAHVEEDKVQFELLHSEVGSIAAGQVAALQRSNVTLFLASLLLVAVSLFAIVRSVQTW